MIIQHVLIILLLTATINIIPPLRFKFKPADAAFAWSGCKKHCNMFGFGLKFTDKAYLGKEDIKYS